MKAFAIAAIAALVCSTTTAAFACGAAHGKTASNLPDKVASSTQATGGSGSHAAQLPRRN